MNVRRFPQQGNVTGLHTRGSSYHPDFAVVARNRVAMARAAAGLSPTEFADALSALVGRPVDARHVTAWETRTTPPGDVLLAAAALAPTSGSRLGVRSHKFIAAHLGHQCTDQLREQLDLAETAGQLGKASCWVGSIDGPGDRNRLTAWPWGTVIIHVVDELDLADVTTLAMWRYQSYPENLEWAGGYLRSLTGEESVSAAYVLSLYWVHTVPWLGATLDAGLRLICAPRALVDREFSDVAETQANAERVEQELLAAGYRPTEMRSFGVPGVSSGWASWSGVVYYAHDPLRALPEDDLVAHELGLQSIWAYTGWIGEQIESGGTPQIHPRYGYPFLRSVRSLLLSARPQETGQHRQMRDAIVSTSGLPDQLGLAMDAVKEAGI
ncbi:hypothetical protein [Nocardia sp. NPDC051570]|uniref:hypothetical protein n=1 Tax=Nocardia sp. NPDC051570 TaxID=3364324 RepID=UPI0037B40DA2